MKLLLQPLPIRIFHWVMFVCVMVLLFTGLYINNPISAITVPLNMVRKIHSMFGLILIANLLGQIYYYAVTKKFTEILLLPGDWVNMRSFTRYVLFITDGHPNFGRYNPGQKWLFTSWGVAVLVASFTSMILLFPDKTSWLQLHLGGLNTVRILHYFVAIFFAATIPLHFYLVFTEDPAKLQAIFTGYIEKEPNKTDKND
ncbi:MAG: iron hydrogenase [Veillonellaceae bacterium]|jgi:Ni/Fe-hydrogenase 1 B-type cytochrome subunit|nr:iron hydrogenase [Veillonellaceae bacterium]